MSPHAAIQALERGDLALAEELARCLNPRARRALHPVLLPMRAMFRER